MEENKEKELEEIKKKFFKDIQDETNIYNINKFLEEEDAKIIVPILKKINEYFHNKTEAMKFFNEKYSTSLATQLLKYDGQIWIIKK